MPGLRIGNADEITKLGLDPKGRMSLQLDKSRYKLPVSFRAGRYVVCMYYVQKSPEVNGPRLTCATVSKQLRTSAREAAKAIVGRCVGERG